MTKSIRFIHVADLHLGAPTRGLGALTEEWAKRLQTAIPEAYDRVIEAALTREVDFVVFAGDVFDASGVSYCDFLHFFEGLEKLHAAGIPSYLIAGNHDPYTSWARNIARLPASAHMMGIGVPTFELFEREGEPLCLIGGRSYYAQAWPLDEGVADGITRANAIGALAEKHPHAADAPFAIGIIHTGLELDASKAAVSEQFLLAQDIDYWACGHLHRHMVRPIADDPRIVFPGCVQGRDIKESGERGCYLVELQEGVSPRLEFVPTASVSFHSLDVDVSACRTLSDVERIVKVELFRDNGHDYCSEMVARVNLVGKTDLHGYLRQPDVVADMRKRVNDACPGFFLDAVIDGTCSPGKGESGCEGEGESGCEGEGEGRPAEARSAPPRAEGVQPAFAESDGALIDYVQNTLVQRGVAVPDALSRRIGDFRTAAAIRVADLQADGEAGELPLSESLETIRSLGNQLESKYLEVRRATEKAASHRQDDRELRELAAGRKVAADRVTALGNEIDDMRDWCEQLESVDDALAMRRVELARLRDAAAELTVLVKDEDAVDPRLLGMTTQDDRVLRDKLEELSEEREKLARAVDDAKERSATSTAAYEALQEIDIDDAQAKRRDTRKVQAVVSVLLPVVFMVAGVVSFVHGRQINSLSFTVFGIGVVVLAFLLAAAAMVVLFRPNREEDALESRKQDAHWVMLQDKKLLDTRLAEKEASDASLHDLLERNGLGSADGSIRQALLLLDDAQEARALMAEQRHRAMAHEMHESTASQALAELEERRRGIEEAAGLQPGASTRTLEAQLRAKEEQRCEAEADQQSADERIDELSRRLAAVRNDRSFDQVKLDYHQIRARLRIAKHDYITLLIADRFLERRASANAD